MLKKYILCVYVYVLNPEKNHKSCPKNQSSRIHSFIYSIHLLSTTFCYVLYDHLGAPKWKIHTWACFLRSSNPVKETGTHVCLQWSEISLQCGEIGTGMVCTSGKTTSAWRIMVTLHWERGRKLKGRDSLFTDMGFLEKQWWITGHETHSIFCWRLKFNMNQI